MLDQGAWRDVNWKALDVKLNHGSDSCSQASDSEEWPSSILTKTEVTDHLQRIWDMFLSDQSVSQICLPSSVLVNTTFRTKLISQYGPSVFTEATLDPIKTIRRDIMPRFMASTFYSDLEVRLEELATLPSAGSFCAAPASSTEISQMLIADSIKLADLEITNFLEDRILYEIYLKYLQSIVSSENLLCVRIIDIYVQLFPISSRETREVTILHFCSYW